jgi:signal transduction histidine kinase
VTAVHVADADASADDALARATVRIEVADDGPGVPEEVRDRIFAPFFTTKPRGSGLGLSIVRKLVDAHEGAIDVVAGPTGTTFRVTLPVTLTSERGGTERAA